MIRHCFKYCLSAPPLRSYRAHSYLRPIAESPWISTQASALASRTRTLTTAAVTSTPPIKATKKMSTFYDLKAPLPGNGTFDFATLKGKVVLIVNTASAWYVGPSQES